MLACGPEEIAALTEKYRLLLDLRRAHERGEPTPGRALFQGLAARFPGALRELDRMPMATLERRLAELAAIGEGAAPPEWMVACASYHALLRFALAHKGKPSPSAVPAGADREFLDGLARPPNGRMVPLVVSAIARGLGREVAEVIALLEG